MPVQLDSTSGSRKQRGGKGGRGGARIKRRPAPFKSVLASVASVRMPRAYHRPRKRHHPRVRRGARRVSVIDGENENTVAGAYVLGTSRPQQVDAVVSVSPHPKIPTAAALRAAAAAAAEARAKATTAEAISTGVLSRAAATDRTPTPRRRWRLPPRGRVIGGVSVGGQLPAIACVADEMTVINAVASPAKIARLDRSDDSDTELSQTLSRSWKEEEERRRREAANLQDALHESFSSQGSIGGCGDVLPPSRPLLPPLVVIDGEE
eukprot:TRINITY_DN38167_c0_g1_i1.p1 TRINITY_DN38167_c0_g1~~TRINITY_DN38167_c0_g1_i1.p1  ORF type:complete len:305 (+),score=63.44 TRINITY_DN38167_c0_g1_i1:122-916(+)